jgi:hypothetical protein
MIRVALRHRRASLLLAFVALWAAVGASTARAQQTTLTITGFPIAFPSPTGSDFFTGYIDSAGSVTFTVAAKTGTTGQRTTTVFIACNGPCPTAGPKPLASLQWRRADLLAWNTLTTTNVQVDQKLVFKGAANDPWSNSIFWRFNLNWLTDPPGVATNFRILFTLTVTVP